MNNVATVRKLASVQGVVVRPQREQRSRNNMSRLSFKVINRNFLLKIGE